MVRTKNVNLGGGDQQPEPPVRPSKAEATKRFAKKQAVQERHFPKTKEFDFYDKAVAMGFKELLKKRDKANLSIVKEFYICSATADELWYSGRNKEFSITAEDIRKICKLPRVQDCRYAYYKTEQKFFDWPEAFRVMGVEGAGFTTSGGNQYFERKYMTEEAKVWLNFMNYNVKPSAHISTISPESTILLYLLMTQQELDVATIARDQILHCVRSTRTSMVFPHLITDLCRARRIEEKSTDVILTPVTTRMFSAARPTPGAESSQSRRKGKRVAVEESEEGQQEAEEGEPGVTMASLSKQIAILTDQVIALSQQVNANEFRRQRFLDPLAFKTAQALNIPVPPGFEHAFWQSSIPASSYFPEGPGQSSRGGEAEAEEEGEAEAEEEGEAEAEEEGEAEAEEEGGAEGEE